MFNPWKKLLLGLTGFILFTVLMWFKDNGNIYDTVLTGGAP